MDFSEVLRKAYGCDGYEFEAPESISDMLVMFLNSCNEITLSDSQETLVDNLLTGIVVAHACINGIYKPSKEQDDIYEMGFACALIRFFNEVVWDYGNRIVEIGKNIVTKDIKDNSLNSIFYSIVSMKSGIENILQRETQRICEKLGIDIEFDIDCISDDANLVKIKLESWCDNECEKKELSDSLNCLKEDLDKGLPEMNKFNGKLKDYFDFEHYANYSKFFQYFSDIINLITQVIYYGIEVTMVIGSNVTYLNDLKEILLHIIQAIGYVHDVLEFRPKNAMKLYTSKVALSKAFSQVNNFVTKFTEEIKSTHSIYQENILMKVKNIAGLLDNLNSDLQAKFNLLTNLVSKSKNIVFNSPVTLMHFEKKTPFLAEIVKLIFLFNNSLINNNYKPQCLVGLTTLLSNYIEKFENDIKNKTSYQSNSSSLHKVNVLKSYYQKLIKENQLAVESPLNDSLKIEIEKTGIEFMVEACIIDNDSKDFDLLMATINQFTMIFLDNIITNDAFLIYERIIHVAVYIGAYYFLTAFSMFNEQLRVANEITSEKSYGLNYICTKLKKYIKVVRNKVMYSQNSLYPIYMFKILNSLKEFCNSITLESESNYKNILEKSISTINKIADNIFGLIDQFNDFICNLDGNFLDSQYKLCKDKIEVLIKEIETTPKESSFIGYETCKLLTKLNALLKYYEDAPTDVLLKIEEDIYIIMESSAFYEKGNENSIFELRQASTNIKKNLVSMEDFIKNHSKNEKVEDINSSLAFYAISRRESLFTMDDNNSKEDFVSKTWNSKLKKDYVQYTKLESGEITIDELMQYEKSHRSSKVSAGSSQVFQDISDTSQENIKADDEVAIEQPPPPKEFIEMISASSSKKVNEEISNKQQQIYIKNSNITFLAPPKTKPPPPNVVPSFSFIPPPPKEAPLPPRITPSISINTQTKIPEKNNSTQNHKLETPKQPEVIASPQIKQNEVPKQPEAIKPSQIKQNEVPKQPEVIIPSQINQNETPKQPEMAPSVNKLNRMKEPEEISLEPQKPINTGLMKPPALTQFQNKKNVNTKLAPAPMLPRRPKQM